MLGFSAIAFLICMAIITLFIALDNTSYAIPKIYGKALLAAWGIIAAIYFLTWCNAAKHIKKHSGMFKIFLGLTAIIVATLSSAYSDIAIGEITGISPQELPGAQRIITFVMQPIIWFIYGSIGLAYASIPAALFIIVIIALQARKPNPYAKSQNQEMFGIAAIITTITIPLIMLAYSKEILRTDFYEPNLRKLIVFASFNLEPETCGLKLPEGSMIAMLKYKRAATAIPHLQKGYVFSTEPCDVTLAGERMDKKADDNKGTEEQEINHSVHDE